MTTYIAWDGNEYPLPPPEGWYLGSDDRWWPEGHGPGPAAAPPPATGGLPSAAPPAEMPSAAPPSGVRETVYSAPPPGVSSSTGDVTTGQEAAPSGGGNGKRVVAIAAVLIGLGAVGAGAWAALGSDDDDDAAPATTVFQTELDDSGEAPTTTTAGEESDDAGTTDTTASADDGRGTIDDPYPIGEPFDVRYEDFESGEERVWSIVVLEPLRNITEAVAEENQFNDPPPRDQQFMGAPIRVTYVSGPAPASLFEITFKAIGPSGVVLTTFDPSCGVIPDALDTFAELFEGGTVEGNVCWSAVEADQQDLTMIVEVFLDDDTVFADLTG